MGLLIPVFLASLLLLLCPSTCAQPCLAGTIPTASGCEICPPGTYRPSSGFFDPPRDKCLPCPVGTFNPNSGAVRRLLCRACYPGTFTNTTSSVTCAPCPPGTDSNAGASVCRRCGPGQRFTALKYNFRGAGRNPSICIDCPENFYSNQPSNLNCKQCPLGFTTVPGAKRKTDCTLCEAGRTTSDGLSGCRSCGNGYYTPSDALGKCLRCPPGTIATRERNTKCMPCPVGFRQRGFVGSICFQCKPGFTTAAQGAQFCKRINLPCPPGTFTNADGNCDRCRYGTRVDTRKNKCVPCEPGSVNGNGLSTNCTPCPPGQRPNKRKNACLCPEGSKFSPTGGCEKCPRGTYRNDRIRYVPAMPFSCFKCDRGTFADKVGSLKCQTCPIGTVADETGSSICKSCPPGSFPNIATSEEEIANVCVDVRTGCPFGFVILDRGPSSGIVPGCMSVSCNAQSPPEDVGVKCIPCRPGERLNKNGKSCIACGRKETSPGGPISKCTKCPNGFFLDTTFSGKCHCRFPNFGINKDGECKRCRKGEFSGNSNPETCSLCPPGTAARSFGGCERCSLGTFTDAPGSKTCKTCPIGFLPNKASGATDCLPDIA